MSAHRGLLLLSVLLAACTKGKDDDSGVAAPQGPVLEHSPASSIPEGEDWTVQVTASDDDGVAAVNLVYRLQNTEYWTSLDMSAEGDLYTVVVPAEEISAPGLEYYFKATDGAEPGAVAYLPVTDPSEQPFVVPVDTASMPLPFEEGFEVDTGELFLYQLGWGSDALAFPGYVWTLSETRAATGTVSVFHSRGVDGVDTMNDWLITPALDFSGQTGVQVSWWETGGNVADANHSLYVSTGSRDPGDGQFQLVTTLLPPSDQGWERAQVVDLSAWAGEPVVYLAWVYQGADADDWYIDDVSVRSLTLDLDAELAWSPDPVHPGETTTLTLTVNNQTLAEGEGLTISASAPTGGGTFTQSEVSTGPVAAEGSVEVEFEFTVDPSWPDNSPMPLSFVATDGLDTWDLDTTLVVGHPSEGRISLDIQEQGTVRVSFGVGDPDAPTWEEEVYADYEPVGTLNISYDLTEQYASLPPAAGPLRWYARIDTSGSGKVTAFELDHGAQTYAATVEPTLIAEDETLVWLPEPPDPRFVSSSTSPSVVAPGDESVFLTMSLRNYGEDFSGPLTLTLSSDDPDVTLPDAEPTVIDAGLLEANESTTLSNAFLFGVAADHFSSLPVSLNLNIDDGVEQWTLPLEVQVPWPVLKITAVTIDDRLDGDGDGLLEPGEGAQLELSITNVGDKDAFGVVAGSLSLDSSSTASATVDGSSTTFGSMTVSRSRSADFAVTVDSSAAAGDTLDLTLTLSDGTASWTPTLQIVLGEPPWLSVSALDDAVGDNNSYTVDLVNAQYRCDGTTFELLFESAEEIDTSTAFIEMWALATAADYTYYRLVLQSGTAKLQGYDSGFVTLLSPTVSFPDSTHALLSWPVADMGLATDSLRVGFGAGWCGSITESFCDHFPDGWGYYYGGSVYTTSRFFTLSW